ncbi:MAG: hypothetical protein J6U01_10065 [Clostridia bacterium]|nr:hypothetical protein [Clostridia bacterium]
MKLLDRIKAVFQRKKTASEPAPEPAAPAKIKKACRECGKTFTVDPSWEHIPNYCKECRQKFAREKEERQRAGEPRKIKRKCRQCGRFFTFPSTLQHYPNYCGNCRKEHKAAMKSKYGNPVKRTKNG